MNNEKEMKYITIMWPEVFTNPNFEYPEGHDGKGEAIANGLMGWANCIITKDEIPKGFGEGMVKIFYRLGLSPTKENLMTAADQWHNERDEMEAENNS